MQSRKIKSMNNETICGGMAEAQARYNYGSATIRQIAENAGAVIRIGRTVRYNFSKMDAYINSVSDGGR